LNAGLILGQWHVIAGPGAPERRLAPVGACIYCRQAEAEGNALEDEHIIPDGIGGDLILPKASCRPRAVRINRWEQEAQKGNLGITRDAVGVKSRKRRGRNGESAPRYRAVAASIPEGANPTLPIGPLITDAAELPRMAIMEITKGPPEILFGKIPGNGIQPLLVLDKTHGPRQVAVEFRTRTGDFLRLLAKIAHGMAAATIGIEAFSPFLTDIVLMNDHRLDDLWKYIGGGTTQIKEDFLHQVRLRREIIGIRSDSGLSLTFTEVIVADIRLFATFSALQYLVVVGTAKDGAPQ
jgi:hypothetical protein